MMRAAEVIFLLVCTRLTVESCSKPRAFFATEGHVLLGHAISTNNVTSLSDCHLFCVEHPKCLSYNFQYMSASPSHECEINYATGQMCPRNITRKEGFKYYEDTEIRTCGTRCPVSLEALFLTSGVDLNNTFNLRLRFMETNEADFQFSFPNKTVHDYVHLNLQDYNPSLPALTEFTICLWIRVSDQSDDGALFSYSLPDEHNEILITDYTSLRFMINGYLRTSERAVNDDQWHHICTTWENTAGTWSVYIDGASVAQGDEFETGHVISSNGTIILGQDQDSHGGGFEQVQSFSGEMYGVNMWNAVLSGEDILCMFRSCSSGIGNYLKFADFVGGLHGNVTMKSPNTCLP